MPLHAVSPACPHCRHSCGPTKATALKIYPPNQTVPVYLSSTSTGCAKSIQIMYIGPVQPGSGSSS